MSRFHTAVAGFFGAGLVRALFTSTRRERVGADHYLALRRRGDPFIFAFWHGQLLPLVHQHGGERFVVLVSEHRDGDYIAGILRAHGCGTVRGSSTRGGARALRSLIRAARSGRDLAITPDGPRGPAGTFKPGALVLARATGLPVIPVAAGASSSWRLASWDGFIVPRPGAVVRIAYAPPVCVPPGAGRADLARIARRIEVTLHGLTRWAAGGAAA